MTTPADPHDSDTELTSDDIASLTPEALVERFKGYVHRIAADLHDPDHHQLTFEDVCAYGYEGLLDAHERFEPDREASFMNFAYYRIHGAICDGLRSGEWSSRHRVVELEDHFESRRDDETPGHYAKDESSHSDSLPTGYRDDEGDEHDDPVTILLMNRADVEHLEHTVTSPQHQHLYGREMSDQMEDALDQLSEMERAIVVRYYLQDETVESIADDLGCSKSWACRLKQRAIDELADILPDFDRNAVAELTSRDVAA